MKVKKYLLLFHFHILVSDVLYYNMEEKSFLTLHFQSIYCVCNLDKIYIYYILFLKTHTVSFKRNHWNYNDFQ